MHRLAPLAAAVLCCGCAAGGTAGPVPQSDRSVARIEMNEGTAEVEVNTDRAAMTRTLPATVDALWAQLPAVYQALGVEGAGVANAAEHVFGRQGFRVYRRIGEARMSTLLNCGDTYAGDADTYDVRMTVMTSLAPAASGGTEVRSWVEASGRQQASSSTLTRCSSKGRLEREIARLLAEKTAAPAPRG